MGVKQLLQNQRPTRTGILEDEMRWDEQQQCGFIYFFLRATSFDGYGAYIKRYLATAQFFVPKRFCCPWGLGWQTVEEMSIRPLAQWLQRPFANWMAVEEMPTGCLLPKHLRSSQYVIIVFSIMPLSSAAYQVSFKQQGPHTSLESASLTHVSNYLQISDSHPSLWPSTFNNI